MGLDLISLLKPLLVLGMLEAVIHEVNLRVINLKHRLVIVAGRLFPILLDVLEHRHEQRVDAYLCLDLLHGQLPLHPQQHSEIVVELEELLALVGGVIELDLRDIDLLALGHGHNSLRHLAFGLAVAKLLLRPFL